jgi:tetratricopeptide (TPR) repeat protein
MLDDVGAAGSPDVRLRFDLGMVQYELAELSGRTDLYEKAARTLADALALGPDAEGSTEALAQLVYAYAKLDRPREELETWHRYIPRIMDPRTRAVDLMNMGEAEMRLGRVDDALATLREVLHECGELPNTSSTYVLTLWDIAVALDRSGDARGALETATKAAHETAVDSHGYPSTGRGLLTRDENVFFVPGWEKYWYLALGSEALAREDTDPREALAYFTESEHEWDQYLIQATAAGLSEGASVGPRRTDDAGRTAALTWLRIAHLRRDRVHAERTAAGKRVPRGPARPAPESE